MRKIFIEKLIFRKALPPLTLAVNYLISTIGMLLYDKDSGRHQENVCSQEKKYGDNIKKGSAGAIPAPMSKSSKRVVRLMLL